MIVKKVIDSYTEKKAINLYGQYYTENRKKLYALIKKLWKQEKSNIAIWGGGLKGIAFLRMVDPKKTYVNVVIDIDESKHGEKLPTGHIIRGIDAIKDYSIGIVLVMNSGFYADVERQIREKGFNVRLISVDGFLQNENRDIPVTDAPIRRETLNLLYRGAGSTCGYQSKILNELKNRNVFDKCVVISQSIDATDFYDPKYFTEIKAYYGYNCEYEKYIDSNKLYPLTEDLLRDMLPYESTAIKMVMRYTNFHIHNYEDSKQEYLKHLRFWNHIIMKEKINAMYFSCIPHTPWEYIIYCIGRVKKIPILILEPSHFLGRYVYGTSIEETGYNTILRYKELKEKVDTEIILSKQMQEFYDKHRLDNIAEMSYKSAKKDRSNVNKEVKRYIKPSSIVKRKIAFVKNIRKYKKSRDKRLLQFELERFKYDNIMTLKALFKYATISKQSYYNKIAQYPDYTKPYVYFALQLVPEATTLPKAGVFEEQLVSIQLLAKSLAKYKIYVYVKEHVVQEFRDKWFYKELLKIKNVKLIKTTVNTYDLINSSVAVSTQTGSCIWEGIFRNKPAIVFTNGYWSEAPGVFKVKDVKTCRAAIEKILAGMVEINDMDLKRYLMAIDQSSIRTFLDPNEHGEHSPSNEESINNVVEVISNWKFE